MVLFTYVRINLQKKCIMNLIGQLDSLIDSPAKVAVLRVFAAHEGLRVTGRDMAKRAGFSAPSTHDALKTLFNYNILDLEIIGKQHIYSLNEGHRLVQKCIRPLFEGERTLKQDIKIFLLDILKREKSLNKIVSIVLYGSVYRGRFDASSDVDVAFIVSEKKYVMSIESIIGEKVMDDFYAYFGMHLDPYIKSVKDFVHLRNRKKSPVPTMMQEHIVLFGKNIEEIGP